MVHITKESKILMALVLGVITDMTETLHALERAADMPVSVIIVGVGQANFGMYSEQVRENR